MARPSQACECGSEDTLCCHADVGGVDYLDEFVLYCFDCGKIDRKDISGGSPMGEDWHNDCPFCGVSSCSHPSMPSCLNGWASHLDPKDYKP